MKQQAHAWVALRALKLLDDWKKAPKLVELIFSYISEVWDGAWLPDIRLYDMSYGHIYKMDSDPDYINNGLNIEEWYQRDYNDLKTHLVGNRLCLEYVKGHSELDKPYRSHTTEGGHLPDRVIALSHNIGDMLKMSDYPLGIYAQKRKKRKKGNIELIDASGNKKYLSDRKIKDLTSSPNFSARHIALTFFIISHYICDAHMPLHCDLRDFKIPRKDRRLPKKMHTWIERLWESNFPSKDDLILTKYSKETLNKIVKEKLPENSIIEIDTPGSQYNLNKKVNTRLKGDEWSELVYTTRVSYAVARKWIPAASNWFDLHEQHFKKYGELKSRILQNEGFGDGAFVEDFIHVTNSIFHDTVESIARIWYKAWKRFID
ncbi:MAG: hypothetical protein JSW11_08875 [Candidatus Heimdallarchaeota archaeon]|nr:MAG: hypothetical protein JSW11_08875 [Candidatus Heimdallarchaeota archaeon]